MFRERDPFGRALTTLRDQLRRGAYGQGQPLGIAQLARDFELSPTPVREALSRLAGRGLVEDRRGRGYFTPRLDVLDVTELYDLSGLHLGQALADLDLAARRPLEDDGAARAALQAVRTGPDPREALGAYSEALFDQIVRAAGNRTLAACHAMTADRLGPVRRVEPLVLAGVPEELADLADRFAASDWAGLGHSVAAFHARRRAAASRIVSALRDVPVTYRNI